MLLHDFILKYRQEDVRKVALMGARFPELDMPFALDQIAGWQTAREKLPTWAAVEGLVFPPHLSMEQCSSEATARYKARLAGEGETMVDLTGGFGVDFSFMAQGFRRCVYVERQAGLCSIARNNLPLLGLKRAEVVCAEAEEVLEGLGRVDLIFLDPARRDAHGAKTYAIEDCTPNVIHLAPKLLQCADRVIIKLSPMLDWHKAVQELPCVEQVHILSVGNECKELLLVLQRNEGAGRSSAGPRIFCANDNLVVEFDCGFSQPPLFLGTELQGRTLLVPNSSIMKSGLFAQFCQRFGAQQIGRNSNLFILNSSCSEEIPARRFLIKQTTTMNKKNLRQALGGIQSANIAVRNFPLSADALRHRLKLKDGGTTFIFATTDTSNNHLLLICERTEQE